MSDWKDFATILSVFLIFVGAAAMGIAAQTFTMVKGKVLEKGISLYALGGKSQTVHTISVLIENEDRVFKIEQGTLVKYAVSDDDANLIDVGSKVELFVSSYDNFAKLVDC